MPMPKSFADFPERFLVCRAYGHSWVFKKLAVVELILDGKVLLMGAIPCSVCKTSKVEYLNDTGHSDARSYDYPNDEKRGYYLIHDVKSWGGRYEFARNAKRELWLRRMKETK